MCYLDHIVPKQESASAKCPRRALERLLAGFAGGPQILVGFEIEFVLLDSDLNLATGLDRVSGYSSMAGLRGDTLSILEEICEALEKADIAVYDFHPEIADQLEVVLSPAEPMQAIDCLMHAQETIRAVAVTHGLRASLAPRPVFNGPQNGSHMHLSLNPLPRSADSFIAGILQNIKALCAFGMPSFDSYVRVTDDGAGCFIGWGTENRDLPIRKITENHWEFRFADATANQYLFMATLLSAGIDGMQKQTKLLWKDCMIFQENLTAEKLKEYGMSEKMPKSLKITIDAAKGHEGLKEWIGETLLAQYLKVKEKELEKFPTLTDEQRRQKYLLFF
jgi:glutamine synthetase